MRRHISLRAIMRAVLAEHAVTVCVGHLDLVLSQDSSTPTIPPSAELCIIDRSRRSERALAAEIVPIAAPTYPSRVCDAMDILHTDLKM